MTLSKRLWSLQWLSNQRHDFVVFAKSEALWLCLNNASKWLTHNSVLPRSWRSCRASLLLAYVRDSRTLHKRMRLYRATNSLCRLTNWLQVDKEIGLLILLLLWIKHWLNDFFVRSWHRHNWLAFLVLFQTILDDVNVSPVACWLRGRCFLPRLITHHFGFLLHDEFDLLILHCVSLIDLFKHYHRARVQKLEHALAFRAQKHLNQALEIVWLQVLNHLVDCDLQSITDAIISYHC